MSLQLPIPNRTKQHGLSRMEWVVAVIIIGVLIGLVLPFYPRAAREAARRMQCTNNLKQLALAMQSYHDSYKCLPPAYTVDADGNRLHTWRTLLLPFLETHLYPKIDLTKPWNDPVNLAVAAEHPPSVFLCPSDREQKKTHYMVIIDPESCFPGAKSITLKDISDGTSNTLLIIEAPNGSGVDWMSPYDADWAVLASISEKKQGSHHGVFHAALADGSVQAISINSALDVRRSLMTIAADDTRPDEK